MSLKEKTKGKKKCSWGSGGSGAINPPPPAGPEQSLVGTWGKITQNKQFCVLGLKNTWRDKQEFSQKPWLPQFWVLMVPQFHGKYEANLMSQSWEKNASIIGKQINIGSFCTFLACFCTNKNFYKKFYSISFEYLWSLNFMQNIK